MARAWTTAWSRSFQAIAPTADTAGESVPSATVAVRRPMFCWMRGLMVTVPASAPSAPA